MINYLKSILYSITIILISTIIITIFNYYNIINGKTLNIICFVIPIISIFIGSLILGKKTSSKGYIEGAKYSTFFILIILIFNIITKSLSITSIITFITILLFSILGAILGINFKKN